MVYRHIQDTHWKSLTPSTEMQLVYSTALNVTLEDINHMIIENHIFMVRQGLKKRLKFQTDCH